MSGLRKPNLAPTAPVQGQEPPFDTEETGPVQEQAPVQEQVARPAPVPVPVPANAPAPVQALSLASKSSMDRDESFDDLEDELGFGSFPMLKLDKTEFVCGNHTMDAVDEVILLQGKKKHLFKARKGEDDGIPLVYSYDGKYSVQGEALEQVFAEWREAGEMDENSQPVKATYMEVFAHVLSCSVKELIGEQVMMNIAPQSLKTLSGYQKKLALKGYRLNQAVTRVQKGAKVTISNSSKTFYPWDFKFVRAVPEDFSL